MSSSTEDAGPRPTVIANGRAVAFTPPATLFSLLVELGLPPRSVVVEHNGAAVAPSEFETRPVSSGDQLEIVRITAGG